jgi:hypothetical protein
MQTCIRVWTVIVLMRSEVRMTTHGINSCCEVGRHAQAHAQAVQHELCKVLQTGAACRQADSDALRRAHPNTLFVLCCSLQ